MLLNKQYETDPQKEIDGVWVEIDETARIKVARANNREWQKLDRRLKKPYRKRIRQGRDLPEDVTERIMNELLAKTVLRDWGGIQVIFDESLKAAGLKVPEKTKVGDIVDLPFSIKNALVLFADERFKDFKEEVASAAMERELFRKELDEDAEKN